MLLLDTQPTLALLHNDHRFIEMISPDGPFQQHKKNRRNFKTPRGLLYLEMSKCAAMTKYVLCILSETVQERFEEKIPQSLI